MRAECLVTLSTSQRGQRMLRALVSTCQFPCHRVTYPSGRADVLIVFGGGGRDRMRHWQQHVALGKHAMLWDLGYWDRQEKLRVSIDSMHPRPEQMSHAGRSHPFKLRDDYNPNGHIVLVGMGPKSRALSPYLAQWETMMVERIRAAYPGRPILYRPKPRPGVVPELRHCMPSPLGPIEHDLRGASLVVCHHSNVAIDACVAGVPVVCEDGAARALYGSDLLNPNHPTHGERESFLSRLAMWQWAPEEAHEAWKFLGRFLTMPVPVDSISA